MMDWNFFQPFLPNRHKSVSNSTLNASADVSYMLNNMKEKQSAYYINSNFPIGKTEKTCSDLSSSGYQPHVFKPSSRQNSFHFMSFSLNIPVNSGQIYDFYCNPNMKCSYPLNPYAEEFVPNKLWRFHPGSDSKGMSNNFVSCQRPVCKNTSMDLLGEANIYGKGLGAKIQPNLGFCLPSEEVINATALGAMKCKAENPIFSTISSPTFKICDKEFSCMNNSTSNAPSCCRKFSHTNSCDSKLRDFTKFNNICSNFRYPCQTSYNCPQSVINKFSSKNTMTLASLPKETSNSDKCSSNSKDKKSESQSVMQSTSSSLGNDKCAGQDGPSTINSSDNLFPMNSKACNACTEKEIPSVPSSKSKDDSLVNDCSQSDLGSEDEICFEECASDVPLDCQSHSYLDDSSVDFTFSPQSESFISSSNESTKVNSDDKFSPGISAHKGCNILSFILSQSPTDNCCGDDVFDNSDYDCDIFDLDLEDCSDLGFSIGGALVVPSCSYVQSCDSRVGSSKLDGKNIQNEIEKDSNKKNLPDEILEANERWSKEIDLNSIQQTPTKITFNDNVDIYPVEYWDRAGPWEEYARDRMRFKKRIEEAEDLLAPIFQQSHRDHILERMEINS